MIKFSSSQLVISEYGICDIEKPVFLDDESSLNAFQIGTAS